MLLRDWKRVWNDGLIPEEVLTYNESSYMEAFKSGEYVISPQQIYDLASFNDPANSKIAGHVSLLPYQGQSWGVLDSAVYVMSNRDRSDALEKRCRENGKLVWLQRSEWRSICWC